MSLSTFCFDGLHDYGYGNEKFTVKKIYCIPALALYTGADEQKVYSTTDNSLKVYRE